MGDARGAGDPAPERVARVALGAWVGPSEDVWEVQTVLGLDGDDLELVEIVAGNRERVLADVVDRHARGDRGVRLDLLFFGERGGFFASSASFRELWPRSLAALPAEPFVDERYRGSFAREGDLVVVSVRHALRPSGPPKRCLRFHAEQYVDAMATLERACARLHEDLVALAQQRTPHQVDALRAALSPRGRFEIG